MFCLKIFRMISMIMCSKLQILKHFRIHWLDPMICFLAINPLRYKFKVTIRLKMHLPLNMLKDSILQLGNIPNHSAHNLITPIYKIIHHHLLLILVYILLPPDHNIQVKK